MATGFMYADSIEFTNYCKNDCYYCGIRKSNQNAERYRLSTEQILECTDTGYELGFRTFVLQGGEDARYTDERILELVCAIRERHPDCAITLSLGERNRDSYEAFFKAGADRYLLRHETADKEHYEKLHPKEMSFEHRMECLRTLKDIGYQVGCGFMVGSPYQTTQTLAEDRFLYRNCSRIWSGSDRLWRITRHRLEKKRAEPWNRPYICSA